MENTPINKARFYALYMGQKVLVDNTEKGRFPMTIKGFMDEKNVQVEYEAGLTSLYRADETTSLLLTPLEDIAFEDAVEIAKMSTYHNIEVTEILSGLGFGSDDERKTKKNGFKFSYKKIETGRESYSDIYWSSITQKQTDFLRSKGYALPYMILTTEQMTEMGWIKLTSKAEQEHRAGSYVIG